MPYNPLRAGWLREAVAAVDRGMTAQQAARIYGLALTDVSDALRPGSDTRKQLMEIRQHRFYDDQTGRSVIGGY